ncbi:MAG: Ig-like domain-containing protein [Lachnospiraceae bacterium]
MLKKHWKRIFFAMAVFCMAAIVQTTTPQIHGLNTVQAATKVKLNKSKASLVKGQTTQLKVQGTKKKVKWTSSKKSVATVSSKGKVTAKRKGKVTITAKIGKRKYTCKITVYATKADKVIANSRAYYYGTNKKIKDGTYKNCGIDGVYKEYLGSNQKIRLTIMYPGNGDMDINHYTVEYYYDKNEKLVFAYAYKKVNGKLKDYRAYYGTDGKCYRYIESDGTVKTYKNGKNLDECNEMVQLLYNKGSWNIIVANGG